MYSTNTEQIATAEGFIAKIPDSIVKGQYENWLRDVKKDNRISTEELEKFVSLSNALPKNLQNFPQTFAHNVKNYANTARQEAKEGTVEKAKLNDLANQSISTVADVDKKAKQKESKTAQPEPVREGAKLHPDKEIAKPQKTVVVVKGGKK